MSSEQEVLDVDSDEVMGRIRAACERAIHTLARDVPVVTRNQKQALSALVTALSEDVAVVAILEGAWREGREDVILAASASGTGPEEVAPDWSDAESEREVMATWRADSACVRCAHGSVCEIGRSSLMAEAFVLVQRCVRFLPVIQTDEEAVGDRAMR